MCGGDAAVFLNNFDHLLLLLLGRMALLGLRTYVDEAYCYRRSSCLSVCLSDTIVSPVKTAEPIKTYALFCKLTLVQCNSGSNVSTHEHMTNTHTCADCSQGCKRLTHQCSPANISYSQFVLSLFVLEMSASCFHACR